MKIKITSFIFMAVMALQFNSCNKEMNSGSKKSSTTGIIVSKDSSGMITYYPTKSEMAGDIDIINSFVIDNQGNKWFATTSSEIGNNGVYKLDGTNWTTSLLTGNDIMNFFIDNQNELWLTRNNGGSLSLMKLIHSTWTSYSYPPYNPSTGFITDANGNLWCGVNNVNGEGNVTGSGAYKFDYNHWSSYLPDSCIWAINIDKQGNIWAGGITYKNDSAGGSSAFLSEFNGSKWVINNWVTHNLPDSIYGGIFDIFCDDQGNKWLGTLDGIVKFDGTNWNIYNSENSGFSRGIINCFLTDLKGNIWVGTSNGLSTFNGSSWITYNMTNSGLYGNNINCIACDLKGNIWVASSQIRDIPVMTMSSIPAIPISGISKFDGSNWLEYSPTSSVLASRVNHIAVDLQGNVWFLTDSGIVCELVQ